MTKCTLLAIKKSHDEAAQQVIILFCILGNLCCGCRGMHCCNFQRLALNETVDNVSNDVIPCSWVKCVLPILGQI